MRHGASRSPVSMPTSLRDMQLRTAANSQSQSSDLILEKADDARAPTLRSLEHDADVCDFRASTLLHQHLPHSALLNDSYTYM